LVFGTLLELGVFRQEVLDDLDLIDFVDEFAPPIALKHGCGVPGEDGG
jgi:hypothetical protein